MIINEFISDLTYESHAKNIFYLKKLYTKLFIVMEFCYNLKLCWMIIFIYIV